jgi:hypothetical protein
MRWSNSPTVPILLQGTETIERLAASLIGARYWFFWWD